jgi:hypothetical protein
VRVRTGQPRGVAQYNPYLYGSDAAVEEVELRCLREGNSIHACGNKFTFYMRVRGVIVGACSGFDTEYIFVECNSGFVHGRPISQQALREMGVAI